jgi:hypothetical protein
MTHELPVWNKDAAELLAQFLATGAGGVFITLLSSARPGLMAGAETLEATALRAREVAGYEACFREILRMATPPSEDTTATANAFPDIDNDAAWDGDKPKD